MSIDFESFFDTFSRNKKVDFMGFLYTAKKCIKNIRFWHTHIKTDIFNFTATLN